ncbi:MAG: copper amine oxidase N-terminal domain-containing protein [Clostridiales bacterium]|nr:copper amine oxidase N-terminal domain-containing protein [Clostridiales bacterium]
MKKFLSAILIFLLCAACFLPSSLAAEVPTIIVNGKALDCGNVAPFMEQDEVMVPVYPLAEALGFKVEAWDSTTTFVHDTVYDIQLMVRLHNDRPYMHFGGGGRSIDNRVPPMQIGNQVYVPLRPFADAFDYMVEWDENTKTATLINKTDTPYFAGKEADTTYSVLNDRLFISLPEGAALETAHYGGLMGASVDAEYEAIFVLSGNAQTILVNVSEEYAYSTGDIEEDAALYVADINAREAHYLKNTMATPIRLHDAVALLPPSASAAADADMVYVTGALARAADDTLLYVGIYADKKAMLYPEDCRRLAEQITRSVEAGPRALNVDGRTVDMGGFTIDVAPGYIPKLYMGPDFEVWYFIKPVTIDEAESTFGIYLGSWASYDDTEKPFRTEKDRVLGREIVWRIDKDNAAEVLIRTRTQGWDTQMHIFASPATDADWETMREMARSLQGETEATDEVKRQGTNNLTAIVIWSVSGLLLAAVFLAVLLLIRKQRRRKELAIC